MHSAPVFVLSPFAALPRASAADGYQLLLRLQLAGGLPACRCVYGSVERALHHHARDWHVLALG